MCDLLAGYMVARHLHLPLPLRIGFGVGAGVVMRYLASENRLGLPTWTQPDFRVNKDA